MNLFLEFWKDKMNFNPERMDELSKGYFKHIYPLIASQIIERCGIKDGICIDIGSGQGTLAIALAKITDLKIYSLDVSAKMHIIAKKNIEKECLNHKIVSVIGNVHQLPFQDNFIDLIVSRGSMFFWEDKRAAFKEIYRVLKLDGYAYIGGGFGSAELKEKIKQLERKNSHGHDYVKIPKINVLELEKILESAQIKDYQIINDGSGLWVLIKNPQTQGVWGPRNL